MKTETAGAIKAHHCGEQIPTGSIVQLVTEEAVDKALLYARFKRIKGNSGGLTARVSEAQADGAERVLKILGLWRNDCER